MIGYKSRCGRRPRYYGNCYSRDVLDMAPVEMGIAPARGAR
jgi:hypothetical protein